MNSSLLRYSFGQYERHISALILGFFLRWTQQARHLEEVQGEIRNMVIEWVRVTQSDAATIQGKFNI